MSLPVVFIIQTLIHRPFNYSLASIFYIHLSKKLSLSAIKFISSSIQCFYHAQTKQNQHPHIQLRVTYQACVLHLLSISLHSYHRARALDSFQTELMHSHNHAGKDHIAHRGFLPLVRTQDA